MNRCPKFLNAVLPAGLFTLLTVAAATFPAVSSAQSTTLRPFPADALRGTLVVTAPPQVELDGRAAQLSPGARIRDAQNMLVLSGTLVGQPLTVNYVRDSAGLIHQAWILTAAEAREKRPRGSATPQP